MQLNRIALSVAVTLSTFCPPGFCGTFDDLLKSYLGTSSASHAGEISGNEQGVIKTNMNLRQAQLETQLNAGVQSGQLTSQEESDLRSQLNHIGDLQGTYLADGSYSRWEVQSMLQELNNFSTRMNTYLNNGVNRISTSFRDSQGGPHGSYDNSTKQWYHRHNNADDGYLANLRAFQADIDTKQAHLDATITDSVSSGRISWGQSSQLRAELNKIANEEAQFTAHGRMSKDESQQLLSELEALSTRVNSMSQWQNNSHRHRDHDNYGNQDNDRHHDYDRNHNQDFASGQSLLRQRIQLGISSGKFSRSESRLILSDEARMRTLEDQLRNSNPQLSFDEQRNLFSQLDILSKRINKELYDHQVQ